MELGNGETWILVFGFFFLLFGGLVLFNNRFLGSLKKSFWKDDEFDKKNIGDRYIYLHDRFGRGLSTFLLGLIFLGCYLAIKFWP